MTTRSQGKIIKRGEYVVWGSIVQVVGLVLCLTIVGALIGLPLIVFATKWSYRYYCSCCGARVSPTRTQKCPQCGALFPENPV